MIIKQILLQAKTGTQHLKSGLKKKDIAETISNKNYRLCIDNDAVLYLFELNYVTILP